MDQDQQNFENLGPIRIGHSDRSLGEPGGPLIPEKVSMLRFQIQ